MIIEVSPIYFVVAENPFDLAHFIAYFFNNCLDSLFHVLTALNKIFFDVFFLLISFYQFLEDLLNENFFFLLINVFQIDHIQS